MFLQASVPAAIANGPRSVAELARTSVHHSAVDGSGRRTEVDLGDFEGLVERVLATHVVGESVGDAWGLERGIRWTSAVSFRAVLISVRMLAKF